MFGFGAVRADWVDVGLNAGFQPGQFGEGVDGFGGIYLENYRICVIPLLVANAAICLRGILQVEHSFVFF